MFTFTVSHQNTSCVSFRPNQPTESISVLMKHLQIRFSEEFGTCIVHIHVFLRAVFLFIPFVGTLLHLLARYHHQLSISETAWNRRENWVSCHARALTCMWVLVCLPVQGPTLKNTAPQHYYWLLVVKNPQGTYNRLEDPRHHTSMQMYSFPNKHFKM